MSSFPVTAYEQRLIDQHGFMVSTSGDRFVVRDPQNKRQGKREGGNLESLLYHAINARKEIEQKDAEVAAKKGGKKGKAAASAPPATTQAAAPAVEQPATPTPTPPAPKPDEPAAPPASPTVKPPESAPDEIDASELDDSGGKTARRSREPAVKRAPTDWKTGRVGYLILRNPDKTPEEIMKLCEAQQIETKPATVVGLTRYFRLCLEILTKIQEEDSAAQKTAANG